MTHWFKHLRLITHHRHQVIRNGFHCGIFFHTLKHDLTKLSPTEFWRSAKNYQGIASPVNKERQNNNLYSEIAIHHTRRNKHHYEYWVDYYCGSLILKPMPYIYAIEFVCDMLAASKTYDPKHFNGQTVIDYFNKRRKFFLMHDATKDFAVWCFTRYRDLDFKGLKKKDTKKKYLEILKKYPPVQTIKIYDYPEVKK